MCEMCLEVDAEREVQRGLPPGRRWLRRARRLVVGTLELWAASLVMVAMIAWSAFVAVVAVLPIAALLWAARALLGP